MANRTTLERMLRTLTGEELRAVLDEAELASTGTKDQQAERLVDALFGAELTIEDVLLAVRKERLGEMCREIGLDDEGLRAELRERLAEWFNENFAHRVQEAEEEDEEEEEEDEEEALDEKPVRAPSYREPRYAKSLYQELTFVPERAAKSPRDCQHDAKKTLLAGIRAGRPLLLHVATGGGKTLRHPLVFCRGFPQDAGAPGKGLPWS